MLGSVSEAEDVVQEAFLRVHRATQRGEQINSPRAYNATLVTRLAIDELRSAPSRREHYVGEWLPEPLATESTPAEQAEAADSLSLAFLVLLETLTPQQRAAFLLRDVFQYSYAEVAEIIGTSVDSTRHLVARARRHVQERRPRNLATRHQRDELAQRFIAAARAGRPTGTGAPACEGRGPARRRWRQGGRAEAPINGRERVARALSVGVAKLAARGVRVEITAINGQPGGRAIDADAQPIGIMGLDIVEGRIQTIHAIANPDKLRHLNETRHFGTLLRAHRRGPDEEG